MHHLAQDRKITSVCMQASRTASEKGLKGALGDARPVSIHLKQSRCYAALLACHSTETGAGSMILGDSSGADATSFMPAQSYANSLPQSKHTTYVPVTLAAGERRLFPLAVIGKL
jgi:hypothetical protein